MRRWLAGLLALLLAACASMPKTSLYDALGGQDGVTTLVDAIIVEVKADPRIGELFAQTETEYFRERLIEQVCMVADGPCEYTGLPMEDAHSGMDISEREFNWFVEDVESAMQRAGIALPVQNRLLARLAQMRAEVIRQ